MICSICKNNITTKEKILMCKKCNRIICNDCAVLVEEDKPVITFLCKECEKNENSK